MALAAGTRFGAYEITGELGVGGMGEVYRATDTKLGRDVAIKTLPGAFAKDHDRLARFEREAKLLAALNHAHIASIYGLDEHDGTQYLAMELVEGETLEEKLKEGPLPVEDALRLALQIAEALEAAHEKGVVHRDLKPANIMVTGDGQVKVLDFGLAKAFSGDPNQATAGHSPALSLAMTQQGLILGTAGYMSPEQASGQATDQRADIWAFGVVLYEMLTGLPLFSGESVPHILAAVLQTEPDWNRLPKHLHPRLKQLLERCLEKKVRSRYHSIADVRVDIEKVLSEPGGAAQAERQATVPAPSLARRLAIGAVFAVIGGLIVGAAMWSLSPVPERPVTRFSVDLEGPVAFLESIALSPDGRRIVYPTNGQLYSQRLDQDEPTAISGTEQGSNPFFSPDGESLAFFTPTQLKTVGFAGQLPRVIADVDSAQGLVGAWDREGQIFFGQVGRFGLSSVPAVGGTPEPFAGLAEYSDLDYPDVLPGGEWVLFTAQHTVGVWSDSDIVAQNVATGERKVVLESAGHFARYVRTGHLVFVHGATLYAAAFDPKRVEVLGPAVPVVQGVKADETTGHARFAVASNGTLIYEPGTAAGQGGSALVRVDHEGKTSPLSTELREYNNPRVSPDGTRVAVEVTASGARAQIWIMDLATGGATQLTFEGTENKYPVWTPDGQDVLYTSKRGDSFAIYTKAADGTGEATRVFDGTEQLAATDVLPGDLLVYQDKGDAGGRDIFTFDLGGNEPATPFLATPADENSARVSPDGAWIAYVSDESGEDQVYVRPYPSTAGGQRSVSQEGRSSSPVWSRSGDEIDFIGPAPGPLMSVSVTFTPGTITPASPSKLLSVFPGRFQYRDIRATAPYDAMPNGGLVAAQLSGLTPQEDSNVTTERPTIRVVENWTEELKRLVPTK